MERAAEVVAVIGVGGVRVAVEIRCPRGRIGRGWIGAAIGEQ